jgi:CubicO group peptidase (beta-lactamase class C family)
MRLVILFSAFLTTACATQQSRNLDALLRGYEAEGFSGVVLVAKNDRVVLHEGYGFADKERRIRNTTSTRFEIASLTKTFTAAAVLRLEAGGALRTTDLLSQHLGEFPPEKATATIHHLATHTAGLVPDGADLGEGTDREQFIAAVKNVMRESAPGERYRYTNAGYSLLAAVIEKVSGQSYESYVRQHFFPRAAFRGDDEPRLAKGYGADGKLSTPPPLRWATRGAGGMIASVEEVYAWHRALHGGRVLDAAQLAKMFHDWPEEEGYAWHVTRDAKGRRFIHKGGGMREYASQILYYPDERLVIIWASNDLKKRWRQTLNSEIPKVVLAR